MTGVVDIGPYSDGAVGLAIFGIGMMAVCFHCLGTTGVQMESEGMSTRGAASIGAPIFKNQAGILSKPAAECRSRSNNYMKHARFRYVGLRFCIEVIDSTLNERCGA